MKRSYIREILEATDENTISFAGGLPDKTLFPMKELDKSLRSVLKDSSTLQYGLSSGLESLRQKIAARYTEKGLYTRPDEILVTTGSQQALNLIALESLDDGVTIEEPSYLGAISVFGLHKIPMQSMTLEDDGVELEGFSKSLQATRAAYLITDFQNPTGRRYSKEKREAVARIIDESDALLIEDGAYEELYFDHALPSISSMIPEKSLHMGSFSKILAPGLRVGWIRGSRKNITRLLPVKEALDLHTSTLTQSLIDIYWERFGLDTRLSVIREAYYEKMYFFASRLRETLPAFEFEEPKGGMFIYGRLRGIDSRTLARYCMDRDVLLVPGEEFYAGDSGKDKIRFNFTNASPVEIEKGLQVIQDVLNEYF